jgi:hypothetical protein
MKNNNLYKRAVYSRRVFTADDEIRSLLFQVAASNAHMKISDAREECVLMATKLFH